MFTSRRTCAYACVFLGGTLLALLGCPQDNGSGGGGGTTLEEPWSTPTVEYDDECADCQEIAEVNIGHVGQATILENKAIDDEIAQWGDCVESMIACMDDDGTASSCVASSACPDPCKDEFDRLASGLSDEDALLDVFETVFILPGAVCRPDDVEVAP